jgi:hypothetical protein
MKVSNSAAWLLMVGLIAWSSRLLTLLLALSATAFPLSAQTNQDVQKWGDPVDGVQISLYLDSAKPEATGLPAVGLAIRNLGSASKGIVLGEVCGPLTPGWKTTFVVLIITDLQGRSQKLQDVPGPPLLAGCAGLASSFHLDVAPGATSSVPLDLECYYGSVVSFDYAWAGGGEYSLRAEVGSLKSNELRVHFSGNVASRRCFSNALVVPCAGK